MYTKMELSASERRVGQCREQLEKVEREVSRLIAELSDCLGRVDPSIAEPMEEDLYARASQLTRGLSKFVNEYGRCQADRQDLLQQINRLRGAFEYFYSKSFENLVDCEKWHLENQISRHANIYTDRKITNNEY